MITQIDYVLDRVTMYRFVLYYLVAIIAVALGLSAFGLLPYSFLGIVESVVLLLLGCGVANAVFGKVYQAPTNLESTYITALILVCILSPVHSIQDLPLLFWGATLATGSKYILAIRNKHIFNPAAIAVVLTAFWLNQSATWWVGTPLMAPIILIGGLLMVRKLRHTDLVFSFFIASLVTGSVLAALAGHDVFQSMQAVLLRSPLLFFAFVMLTEPLTSPSTRLMQILFGGLVGILFVPQVHIGSLYLTPELALVIGNIFSYLVSSKVKERLTLNKSQKISSDVVEFDFKTVRRLRFQPGQYMEFTLPHPHTDARGNRRYFTIASSPTEKKLKLGVKFYQNGSSFKQQLSSLTPEMAVMAGQLAGDFILPKDSSQKLAFIAGGIGVTPFRSMLKYLADSEEKRSVTLLYMNKTADEIAYTDVFKEARSKIGAKIVYTLTGALPEGWGGSVGRVDEQMIKKEVSDYAERMFYISGPQMMVSSVETVLRNLGVKQELIKKDFFPGLT